MAPRQKNTQPLPTMNSLASLKKGDKATIIGLVPGNDDEQAGISRRLLELGFAPGEEVTVVAESFPGRDPMAIRIGSTIFALRRFEASMISIEQN